MPILLDTPKDIDPGHGSISVSCPYVAIVSFWVDPVNSQLGIMLSYGEITGGAWVSRGQPFTVRVLDTPEILGSGVDPETGAFVTAVAVEADLAFTRLRESFVVAAAHEGMPLYDLLGQYLYEFLLTTNSPATGQPYYQGTIV